MPEPGAPPGCGKESQKHTKPQIKKGNGKLRIKATARRATNHKLLGSRRKDKMTHEGKCRPAGRVRNYR